MADVSDPDPVVLQTQPRLALTHVVRARVRPPEPAPGLGFWGKWKVDGRRWAPLALATVALVVLGVAGVAWLRWAPAWPRRAAAAPLANGATATAPSGSATGSPTTSTRPAPTRRSIGQRTGRPTGGEPTATIAPTATPSGGKPTTAPSSAPRSIGSSQWAAVLSALDRHRQTAFATDDPAPLAAVYVPGTLLRQDLAALHQVVGPGCRLIGLRTRYQGVRVSSTARRQVVLATSASLDASSLQCPGTPTRRLPPHRPVAMTVVLVPNRSSYLISGIEVSV